jgi:hypothetical protein
MAKIKEGRIVDQPDIKTQFKSYVEDWHVIETRASELAPRFMEEFSEWRGTDTDRTLSQFVRHLYDFDTKLKDTDEITRAIQRANYLKRLTDPKEPKPETQTHQDRQSANDQHQSRGSDVVA